jgi:methyl-accepting chemotaxis protein
VKTDVNATVGKLTDIITQIRQSTSMVHEAANEISQGNADLSARTESQASSLEETAASMEEITSTVKESAQNASEANSVTADAKSKAVAGGEVVHNAVGAMKEILTSSHKINDIIGVIDEIAFQTNLLALNAAVEAARAGEHGRGFAVVAGEVRTLSQRSATAAKEIKDLIRESVNKVETGSQLVNNSGQTLADIVKAVEEVAVRVEEIATAAAEQNDGIGQINQAVMQMDDMTQQNAALVEEASASSEALSEQASALNSMVSFFKVGHHQAAIFSSPTAPSVTAPAPSKQMAPPPMDTSIAPAQDQVIKYGGQSTTDEDDWEDF